MAKNCTPLNPSKRALARVKHPLPIPTICPHCKSEVQLVDNQTIYGRPFGDWPYAYRCVNDVCNSYVGLHPFTNLPLGSLANETTRKARTLAKSYFNPLWQCHKMTRDEAYAWLAAKMRISPELCHFGLFSEHQCYEAIRIILNEKQNLLCAL